MRPRLAATTTPQHRQADPSAVALAVDPHTYPTQVEQDEEEDSGRTQHTHEESVRGLQEHVVCDDEAIRQDEDIARHPSNIHAATSPKAAQTMRKASAAPSSSVLVLGAVALVAADAIANRARLPQLGLSIGRHRNHS
eukprot:CAMPEP_0180758310 /NCGR_PEP_ID=MMETSP1038_2-20121128/35213_1 /TAXON_ID=632150 /ORGANISM="Azadinium spinosum, Strain 3D9" /LENGTH=137 /DNA_ID=CAMNT_0022792385 /DNA_START=862 /DNA_END=1273 /DNA_ORIENTATION=-